MNPGQAAILGVIQGLSEFLPISSSAHLALAHWLFGWGDPSQNVPFDVALHVGTLIAVFAYFRKDWIELVSGTASAVRGLHWNEDARRLATLALASVPAAALGFAFKDRFESMHDWPPLMAATLAGVGLLLFWMDRHPAGTRTEPGMLRGFAIGVAQSLALVPGVSRSGITMFAGLSAGLTREAAARFSFMLSTPAIVGATLLDLKDIAAGDPLVIGTGIAASAISGYFAIGVLLRHVTRSGFTPYAIYRIALAAIVLGLWFTRSN